MSSKPLSIDDLPEGSVVALSARPSDALAACGGALALHVRRGDAVKLVVLAGGQGQGAEAREAEVRAAALALGVEDVLWLGQTAEQLPDDHDLVARARAWLPAGGLVYGPTPGGADLATRCVAALALGLVRANLATGATLVSYDLPASTPTDVLFDIAEATPEKEQALERLGLARDASLDAARARASRHEGLERAEALRPVTDREADEALCSAAGFERARATAVLSTWNKCEDVLANLEALHAQTYPFDRVVVVDNASSDDTMEAVRARYPRVELVVMPHSAYGACETFNIGFACADTELIAILDDDVVLPPSWLERATGRMDQEPDSTAIVSTKIVEPGMPAAYSESPAINAERYMSTFRGCASLARKDAIAACGYYDVRLFIYGNERDLTCRLLNRGLRVLQFPGTHAFHKTPFGVQMGKRSLYYHARNAWIVQLKYAPLADLARLPFLVLTKVLLRSKADEESGDISDATGTIGIGSSVRNTKGAWWVLCRAAWSVLLNLPYCLRRREPCRAADFELPLG